MSQPARTTQKGPGFTVNQARVLTSHIIRRRITAPVGLICLLVSGRGLYLEWQGLVTGHQQPADYVQWSFWLLPVGLILIGICKRAVIDCARKRVRLSSGWFHFSLSFHITSHWDLNRFDRIVIQRDRRIGFSAPAANTPWQNSWNLRYRVKLMGDHEVAVNSYDSHEDARRLSLALSTLTGYPVHEVNASGS